MKDKKLIELDDKTIDILEKQAKFQKCCVKNYIEYTLEDQALRCNKPSEEHKNDGRYD